MTLKIIIQIASWDICASPDMYVLSEVERFRIKVSFEPDCGGEQDTNEYVGTVVAFVNNRFVIVYEDTDIRYEKNTLEYLHQYAIDDNGNYIYDIFVN